MPRIELGRNKISGLTGAEHDKVVARDAIDAETSAAILSGFDYVVDGESLHFSYDSFDQQNFSDTANACLMLKSGTQGLPESVTWNAYRSNGELVRLDLTADAFLALYTGGALAHKAACMAEGGAKKEALEGSTS